MGNSLLMRWLLLLILAGGTLGLVNSAVEQPEFMLRVAFLASQDDEDYVGAMAFKTRVEQALPGRVEVRIYPSGQYCGNERECIEGMQSGILELHQTTIGGLASLFGPAQVLDLPYAFSGDEVAECVMDSGLTKMIGDAILEQGLGLRLMAAGNTGGWRSLGTTSAPVRGVADLKGLRIRTLPSALEQQMVRALGGSPIALPWSEVYAALSAGLLDGIKNSAQDIVGMKLHDHVRYLFVDRHAYMTSLWWVSEPAWQKMPPDLREAVTAGFADLEAATRRAAREREAPALEEFQRRGGEITIATPEQRRELREATSGLRAWFAERYGESWLQALDTAVAGCESSPAAGQPETGGSG